MAEVQAVQGPTRAIRVCGCMSVIHRKGEQRRDSGSRCFDGCSVESMRGLHLQREGCFPELPGFVESGRVAEFTRQPSCVPVQSPGRFALLLRPKIRTMVLPIAWASTVLRDALVSGGREYLVLRGELTL